MKFRFMNDHRHLYSLVLMCRVLQVAVFAGRQKEAAISVCGSYLISYLRKITNPTKI